MKMFLMYWGEGYGEHTHTSEVVSLSEIETGKRFDADLIAWCKAAYSAEGTWHFSGPCDEFYIMCVNAGEQHEK